jgi:prepilin-type N-terminal cleavage/methylation domain-containing protein
MIGAMGVFPASARPRVWASPGKRGFTLIEILMVVIILGIASAIILPQLASRDDLRCASAARQLMGDLLYTQSRSIALGKMHYVQFSSGSYSVMVDNSGAPGAVITNPVSQVPYTQTIGTGNLTNVSIKTANFDGNFTLAFDSMGVPYSWSGTTGLAALNSGTVVFKAGTNSKTITVSPYSGEIKVN